jgi:hypothetical protein
VYGTVGIFLHLAGNLMRASPPDFKMKRRWRMWMDIINGMN